MIEVGVTGGNAVLGVQKCATAAGDSLRVPTRAALSILVDEDYSGRLEGECKSRSNSPSQKRLIGSVALPE